MYVICDVCLQGYNVSVWRDMTLVANLLTKDTKVTQPIQDGRYTVMVKVAVKGAPDGKPAKHMFECKLTFPVP